MCLDRTTGSDHAVLRHKVRFSDDLVQCRNSRSAVELLDIGLHLMVNLPLPPTQPDGLLLTKPIIVAPDTSHWASWIDDALDPLSSKNGSALKLHDRLLAQGKVPLLSWHHLEELLCVASEDNAAARVRFIQSLPMVAFMRMPGEEASLAPITDLLSAEAIAATEGATSTAQVRDRARAMLLRIGSGVEAIGSEGWVWQVARRAMLERKPHSGMVAALAGLPGVDSTVIFGSLKSHRRTSPEEQMRAFATLRQKAYAEAMRADPRREAAEASLLADAFLSRVIEMTPSSEISPKEMFARIYISQGLDAAEIRDDATIEELSTLATFRTQLRVVADRTRLPFETLKRIPDRLLPSRRIAEALRLHGQDRAARPASDVHDRALAALAANVDVLYVDKRPSEDIVRVGSREPELAGIFGTVKKASTYLALAD